MLSNGNGKPNKKLAIGFLSPGTVRTQFFMSMIQYREWDLMNGNITGAVIPQVGLYIAGMRNKVVRDFLTTPYEWLLMMDSDHIFAPQVPHLLLQSAEGVGARVMSALYFGLLGHNRPAPMWFQRLPNGDYATIQELKFDIQQIDAFGCGMVLIHRSVFEEMGQKYQDDSWKWFAHDPVMYHGELARYGEDICFCRRASDMGIPIYGDSRIYIGHEKTFNLDFDLFLKLDAQRDKDEQTPYVVPVV